MCNPQTTPVKKLKIKRYVFLKKTIHINSAVLLELA